MFSPEELAIIKMYSGFIPDRNKTIAALTESISLIEEPEIKEAVSDIIRKSKAMTVDAFAKIDLSGALDAADIIVPKN